MSTPSWVNALSERMLHSALISFAIKTTKSHGFFSSAFPLQMDNTGSKNPVPSHQMRKFGD